MDYRPFGCTGAFGTQVFRGMFAGAGEASLICGSRVAVVSGSGAVVLVSDLSGEAAGSTGLRHAQRATRANRKNRNNRREADWLF